MLALRAFGPRSTSGGRPSGCGRRDVRAGSIWGTHLRGDLSSGSDSNTSWLGRLMLNGPYGASYGLVWGLKLIPTGLTKSTDHPSAIFMAWEVRGSLMTSDAHGVSIA